MNSKILRLPSVAHWYDGFARSPNVSAESCCMKCFQSMPPEKLLACNISGVYQYCSEDCREKGTKCTKKYSDRIYRLRHAVQALQQNADLLTFYQTAGNVGNFRKNRVAFTYLRERVKLFDAIYEIACQYCIQSHWEEMNSIMQENLRLCHLNPQRNWCTKFAASLLHGGRVDDAICFSQYTIRRSLSNRKDSFHEGSGEGDWIYGSDNLLGKDIEWRNADSFFVFIIYLGKLKQLMSCTFIRQAIGALLTTDFGKEIEGMQIPLALLLEYIIPFKSMKVANWNEFLECSSRLHSELMELTEVIYATHPNIFKFMKQNTNGDQCVPMKKTAASQMSAFQTVRMCQYSLESIPDVQLWLQYCERHLSAQRKHIVIL